MLYFLQGIVYKLQYIAWFMYERIFIRFTTTLEIVFNNGP
jgi:hypothetical protein